MSSTSGPAEVEVTIEKGVHRGQGLGRLSGGQVVFVPGALPGDVWRVALGRGGRDYYHARPLALLRPGAGRRPPPCRHAGLCGGCSYQELDYDAQVTLKSAVLHESLARAGVPFEDPIPIVQGPEHGWRTRAALHFDTRGRLGLHEQGSHRVVDLDECLQLSVELQALCRTLAAALKALAGGPSVRGIDLAESGDRSRRVVWLYARQRAPASAWRNLGLQELPGLDAAGIQVGQGRHGRRVWAAGDLHVETEVLGLRLRSHVCSFFQANRFLVEGLTSAVLEELGEDDGPVLDLYAGVGLFALPLAARGHDVRAVEWSAAAAADLRANARQNGLALDVRQADVQRVLAGTGSRPRERIVLDPPRSGVAPGVVQAILDRRPERIVYVSCDPATLARDLRLLAAGGYVAASIKLFDMFPTTFHVETVVRLVRA